jgi:transcriptional regulator with XRE-family HTH domain
METQLKSQILLAFGQAVRKRRLEIGLSQEAFAEKSQLHRTYIGGIERGKRNVALLNLIQIAQALEITPEELLARISANLQEDFPKL